MTHAEASALITTLSLAFPRERFTPENAVVYERAIADLEAEDVQRAIESLLQYAHRLPVIAELRGEAAKAKIARLGAGRALPLLEPNDSELENTFQASLARASEASSRYSQMAREWYQARGKAFPGDPGLPFVRALAEGVKSPHYTRDVVDALSRGMRNA